mmetsp:Transcript_90691/g.219995  ORF Transcript_90691/g.219995 Transcript_90691/m.219995 type:complete len:278 (-) Transcript_90691:21-854(-)
MLVLLVLVLLIFLFPLLVLVLVLVFHLGLAVLALFVVLVLIVLLLLVIVLLVLLLLCLLLVLRFFLLLRLSRLFFQERSTGLAFMIMAGLTFIGPLWTMIVLQIGNLLDTFSHFCLRRELHGLAGRVHSHGRAEVPGLVCCLPVRGGVACQDVCVGRAAAGLVRRSLPGSGSVACQDVGVGWTAGGLRHRDGAGIDLEGTVRAHLPRDKLGGRRGKGHCSSADEAAAWARRRGSCDRCQQCGRNRQSGTGSIPPHHGAGKGSWRNCFLVEVLSAATA